MTKLGSKGKNFVFSSTRFGIPLDPETATSEEVGQWLANIGILDGSIRSDQREQAAKGLAEWDLKFQLALAEARSQFDREGGDLEQMLEEAAHRVIGEIEGLSGERIQELWKKKRVSREAQTRALPGVRLYAEIRAGRFHELNEAERQQVVFVIPDHLPNPIGAEFVLRYHEESFSGGDHRREDIFEGILELGVAPQLLLLMIDLREHTEGNLSNEGVIQGFISGVSNQVDHVPCLQELIAAGLQIRVWCLVPNSPNWKCSLKPIDEMFEQLG